VPQQGVKSSTIEIGLLIDQYGYKINMGATRVSMNILKRTFNSGPINRVVIRKFRNWKKEVPITRLLS